MGRKMQLVIRYIVAILAVGGALLFRRLLDPYTPVENPFVVMFLGVLIGAWYGGFGPGLVATLLAALAADYFYLPPLGKLFFNGLGHDVRLGLFVTEGLFVSWLVGTLHTTLARHKQSESELALADRRKDEFLATLSHELRNQLGPLSNGLHLLARSRDNEALNDQARSMMERQISLMSRLVEDLLDVSRISRGKLELRRELVDLRSVVRSAVESSSPSIEARGHELQIDCPPYPVWVDVDPARMVQVLTNLLNNAAKYTPEGGWIRLSLKRHGHEAWLQVCDNGIGIPRDVLPRIFDLFVQADGAAGHSSGGLGLGLPLVRWLVERHGGSVRALSGGPGKGSEFIVRLPARARAPRQAGRISDGPASLEKLLPLRILVVDDNQDAADGLSMLLHFDGHHVRTVYSGSDALRAADDFQPQVVLLDIGLPDLDGYEVARRLRARLAKVRLIALTGYGRAEDRERSEAAGFDHHVLKPVDIDRLQSLLCSFGTAQEQLVGQR